MFTAVRGEKAQFYLFHRQALKDNRVDLHDWLQVLKTRTGMSNFNYWHSSNIELPVSENQCIQSTIRVFKAQRHPSKECLISYWDRIHQHFLYNILHHYHGEWYVIQVISDTLIKLWSTHASRSWLSYWVRISPDPALVSSFLFLWHMTIKINQSSSRTNLTSLNPYIISSINKALV